MPLKRKKKRQYRWFIEPIGGEANSSVSALLKPTEADEIELREDECQDGRRHLVYRCQREDIEKFSQPPGVNVRFWKQEGNGKIRPFTPFDSMPKKKRSPKAGQKEKQGSLF